MSDFFEKDIDYDDDYLASLEANDRDDISDNSFVYDKPLLHIKLEYSSESLFAVIEPNKEYEPGTYVIVPTRYGKDLGVVLGYAKKPIGIKQEDIIAIARVATKDDLARVAALSEKEAEASKVFKEKVANHKLDMKLVCTHFLFEEQKALFFFSSDNRVDFRELVKDLVSVFRMRIELRQIGVRDEARITGGLGACGRSLCCHSVSDKLRPVSIRMAKEQNLSLNSMKISGQCGRLLCCLAYESNWYSEVRKKLPQEGIRIFYDGTMFKVIEVNLLTSLVKMSGEDGRLLEINTKRFVKDRSNRWKIV